MFFTFPNVLKWFLVVNCQICHLNRLLSLPLLRKQPGSLIPNVSHAIRSPSGREVSVDVSAASVQKYRKILLQSPKHTQTHTPVIQNHS